MNFLTNVITECLFSSVHNTNHVPIDNMISSSK